MQNLLAAAELHACGLTSRFACLWTCPACPCPAALLRVTDSLRVLVHVRASVRVLCVRARRCRCGAAFYPLPPQIDAFVSTHLGGPFQLEPPSGKARGPSHRHHWLDALAATAGGYNITFDRAMVARLHSRTAEAAALLQRLAALMFDGSDFASLHGAVRSLFAVVDAFVGEASADLAAAAEVISCCRLVSSAAVTTWWGGVKEGVSVVAMCVVGVAALGVVMLVIAVRSSRRQRLTLPQAASELLPSWSPSPSMRFSDSRPGSLRVPGTYGGTLPGGFGSPPGSGRLQGFGSPTA